MKFLMIKLQAPGGILLCAIAGTYLPATGGTHLSATGGTPRASRANYLKIPKSTIYEKLAGGDIPGCKPAKGWVLYQDELDMWVEASRVNPVPLTQEEMNASILASHRRKPNNVRV